MPEAESKPISLSEMLKRGPARFVLMAFAGWWLFVGLSGQTWWPRLKTTWDFTATGQLGDSFGILSALMTSMAAIFTYQTLVDTRQQARLAASEAERAQKAAHRARADADRDRDEAQRQSREQSVRELKRDAEQTFFRLLELRSNVLEDMRIGKGEAAVTGTDAAGRLVQSVKNYVTNGTASSHQYAYSILYGRSENDLGHYYRTTYHIVRFCDERFSETDAYEYVRLLRAQLSNAELILIALTCAFGEGQLKFKPLVVKYALLHNMSDADRVGFEFDRYFGARAFDPDRHIDAPPLKGLT